MQVRFWGTRGSIATPGLNTAHYGGNTSCVEVRSDDTLVILDCGTGVRALGLQLAAQPGPITAHLLLTHIHWDHIQGFPFFTPIFLPRATLDVYGAAGLEQNLNEALSGQMQYTYFPVELNDLPARLTFYELGETEFPLGAVRVRSQYLNHTCPTLGYRLSAGGASVAYLTDHEPFVPYDPAAPVDAAFVHPGGRRHVAFAAGVDLLIHDAQYTTEEYPAKRGWGHSTIDYVVDVAVAAQVKRLALFHHEPTRDDAALHRLVDHARERARLRGAYALEVFGAAEGQVVELPESCAPIEVTSPLVAPRPMPIPRLLIVGAPKERRALRWALIEDGYYIGEADLDEPVAEVHGAPPDAVLVVPPELADAESLVMWMAETHRASSVVVVLDGPADRELVGRLGVVAADVLLGPYTLPTLRARVRACLGQRGVSTGLPRPRPTSGGEMLHAVDRLSVEGLEELLGSGLRCAFQPGEVLFEEGDPPGGVYYVHRGRLRMTIQAPGGREVTAGHAGPGDTVGEMSALDGGPRSATVTALEPVDATYLTSHAFRSALEQSPTTAVRLLRLMVRRMREVDQRLVGYGPEDDAIPGVVSGATALAVGSGAALT